jgi:hypothetical protein
MISSVCVLGMCGLLAATSPAATVTMTFSGTLGPVLSGSDPLGGNGQSGTITLMANEALNPVKATSVYAAYQLPPGAVSIVIGGTTYTTPGPTLMVIAVPAKGSDLVILKTSVTIFGITGTVVGTASLANGSFPRSVLTHPTTFSPSPQTLTAATSAQGPGSKVQYTVFGSTTVLGLAGTASDSAAN